MMSNQRDNQSADYKSSIFTEDEDQSAFGAGCFMQKLFEKQLYTDVTFHLNKSTAISAHRTVLAAQSPFFANLLFGDQMLNVTGMRMQVEIAQVPFNIFIKILKYFYTGDVELTDDKTVLEIYAAAESFEIQKLVDQCKIYIESIELTEDNVCSTLQMCNCKNIEGLKNRCLRYIKDNTFKVISSPDFEKCSFSTLREICDLPSLNLVSERELLDAIMKWVRIQPKHTKKELMKAFVKCVRFLNFTAKEFSDVLLNYSEIMPAEEGLKILMYLNSPTTEMLKTLPKWCNKMLRSFQGDRDDFQEEPKKSCYEEHKIKISLKTTDEEQTFKELISVLRMTCIKRRHKINSIKFSFEDISSGGSPLAFIVMSVTVLPKKFTFRKNFTVKSRDSTFTFPRPVDVHAGEEVLLEIRAERNLSCRFLQFQRWHNDPKEEFQIFLISKPKAGALNFISEIVYTSR